jgi:hypothetical protein
MHDGLLTFYVISPNLGRMVKVIALAHAARSRPWIEVNFVLDDGIVEFGLKVFWIKRILTVAICLSIVELVAGIRFVLRVA